MHVYSYMGMVASFIFIPKNTISIFYLKLS